MLAFLGFAALALLENFQLPSFSSSNRTITSYIIGGEKTLPGEYPYFGKLEKASVVEVKSNAYIILILLFSMVHSPNTTLWRCPYRS